MSQTAPNWVVPFMRIGYGARAVVYATLGVLAFSAAIWGGQAQGTRNALATLAQETVGVIALWIVAIGLLAYGLWRLTAAVYDLEDRGSDATGVFARTALVVTGLIHIGLGVGVALMALGSGRSEGGGAEDMTASLMQVPGGKWIAVAVGMCFAGAGVHYVIKGYRRKYERFIQVTDFTRRIDPALRAGFVCYGIVLGIVGGFLTIAAWQADPSQAKGIGDALSFVRAQSYGPLLLGALGLGLIAFALENMVEAIYRVVPGASDNTIETLASVARKAI